MGYDAYKPADVPTNIWTRPCKATNSSSVQIVLLNGLDNDGFAVAANGNKIYHYLNCSGAETLLHICTLKGTAQAIWDLFINGVSDSTGYDDYDAVSATQNRAITLTARPKPGLNTIEIRVNGKNGASSAYNVWDYGVRIL